MKRFLAVVVAALVIALALWVTLRVQQANRRMNVSELLPKATILLAHLPDLKQTQEQWRGSDLYALLHEPAVQAYLQKPLARFTQNRPDRQAWDEFLGLNPTDNFLALASLENNEPKFIGGFHFEGAEAKAQKFVETREAPLLAKWSSNQREVIHYQDHQIETVKVGRFALATVFDRNWFFASNDLAALKDLLDRADRRRPDAAKNSLRESGVFIEATKQLPEKFAGMFFVDPQPLVQRLLPLLAMTGQATATDRLQQVKEIRSFAGALAFDHGKMREATFIGMPQRHPGEKLSRPSLATAGQDVFLYSASLLSWPQAWQLSAANSQPALPAFLQQALSALAKAGISQADFATAFGDEIEMVGSWPQEVHWPRFALLLPVKDGVRARKIFDALASSELFRASWTRTEKDGASYLAMPGFGGFLPVKPTIALSGQMLVAGSDEAAVDAAIAVKSPPADALQKSEAFREAAARVSAGESAFSFIDTRRFFERADAAVRPLLLMSATIYPALGRTIDVSKLPPTETIAKHLSPIVMSQHYHGGGYVTDSVGLITFHELTLGGAGILAATYVHMLQGMPDLVRRVVPSATPRPSPALAPTPLLTPTASPTAF